MIPQPFPLPTSHFPLPTSHFTLHTSHFTLHTSHATIYHTEHPKPNFTPRTKIPSFLTNSDYILRLTIDPEVDYVKKLVTRCRMSDACR